MCPEEAHTHSWTTYHGTCNRSTSLLQPWPWKGFTSTLWDSHISAVTSSQMALFILVLRLLTGAMFLQQHLIRGVCTRHGPNKKEGPWNCQRQRVGTAVKVTQLPLKGHYVCCSRPAQFFCRHPPASDPWQTPRRAATNMAGTKGHVLPRVLRLILLPTSWGGLLRAHL